MIVNVGSIYIHGQALRSWSITRLQHQTSGVLRRLDNDRLENWTTGTFFQSEWAATNAFSNVLQDTLSRALLRFKTASTVEDAKDFGPSRSVIHVPRIAKLY